MFHLVGLFTAGFGTIFFWTDRQGRASRALALCLFVLGVRLFLAPLEISAPSIAVTALARTMEALCILAGMEWARRIAETVPRRIARAANALFRAAQIVTLVYAGLSLGYLALNPEDAISNVPGVFRVRALEWAVFAPVLGSALLLAGIAILLLLFGRADPAESIRLRALMLAAPFLISALMVQPAKVPYSIALGLLVILFGAVRYLMVQGRRGQLMSQFLAPEVSTLMRHKGPEQVLRRERRVISAVFCDIRGFTRYTETNPTTAVVQLLEQYYAVVGSAAAVESATVKDHAGDGVLLLLGAPVAHRNHAERAARLAVSLAEKLRPLLAMQGLGVGIGVASGEATVGAIQGAGRLEYVAVGPVINLAARLCQAAGNGEVLLDRSTLQALPPEQAQAFARADDALLMKGIEGPVEVFAQQC